jgi:lysophospholipase L1-like esterase
MTKDVRIQQAHHHFRGMGRKAIALTTCTAFAACAMEPPPQTTVKRPDPSQNQVYSDGRVEPDVPPGNCEAYIAQHYAHPQLMAIGDSLYNGVQSMRINWWLSEWSAPTLVAIRTGLIDEFRADRTGGRKFYDPQYPGQGRPAGRQTQDYGFNLENVSLGQVVGLPSDQYTALAALNTYTPSNNRPVVDNLAFSGAQSSDLLDWTGADYQHNVDTLLPKLRRANLFTQFGILSDAFFNVNARFVLNPTRNACIDKLSPLRQVELRAPQRLLVNIGANDGLWRIAFFGDSIDKPSCPIPNTNRTVGGKPECRGDTIAETAGPIYLENMRQIIKALSADKGVGWIYINGMPLPSQTANLVPNADASRWSSDLFDGKFARAGLTKEQMKAADDLISGVNASLSNMVDDADAAARPGFPHFSFVDLADKLSHYDYKGCVSRTPTNACWKQRLYVTKARFGVKFDQPLDNNPLKFYGNGGPDPVGDMRQRIKQGGLMSFDNMHLSTVGYEIMAEAVLDRIRDKERLPAIGTRTNPDPCKSITEKGYENMKPGDCIADMVTPGWAYADATERNFVFDRLGGARQTQNQQLFGAIAGFAEGIIQKNGASK